MNKTELKAKAEELGVELDGDETSAVLKAKIAEAEKSGAAKAGDEPVNPEEFDTGEEEIAEAEEREAEEDFNGVAGLTDEQIEENPQGEPELEEGEERAEEEHGHYENSGVITYGDGSIAEPQPEANDPEKMKEEDERRANEEPSDSESESDDDTVLVRYKGQAGSYFIAGTRFTVRQPIQAVAKEDAERITQGTEFEIVSDEEAKEFYSE